MVLPRPNNHRHLQTMGYHSRMKTFDLYCGFLKSRFQELRCSDGFRWVGLGESSGASRFVKKDSASERVAYLAVLQHLRRVKLPFERLVGWFDFVATEQSQRRPSNCSAAGVLGPHSHHAANKAPAVCGLGNPGGNR